MPRCDIAIELDGGADSVVLGEEIRGRVLVECSEKVQCDSLSLRLVGSRRFRGETLTRDAESSRLFSGLWPGGTRMSYPFAIPTAALAPTFTGKELRLEWSVEARADIPWAIDAKARKAVVLRVSPAGAAHGKDEYAEALREGLARPDVAAALKGVGAAAGCFLWILCVPFIVIGLTIAGGGVYLGFVEPLQEGKSLSDLTGLPMRVLAVLFPLSFAVIPIVVLVLKRRGARADRDLGTVAVTGHPDSARPGDAVPVRVTIRPAGDTRLQGAELFLAVCEGGLFSTRNSKRTSVVPLTNTVTTHRFPVSHPETLPAGGEVSFDGVITFPAGVPCTFRSSDAWVECTVGVRLSIRGGGQREFAAPIRVLPPA